MMKKHQKRLPIVICTAILLVAMLTTIFASVLSSASGEELGESPFFGLFENELKVDSSKFYDGTTVMKLPDSVKDTDEISLIIDIGGETLLDVYDEGYTSMSFSDFYLTDAALEVREKIANGAKKLCTKLTDKGIDYALGESYTTVLSGFEITVKAGDFLDVCKTFGDGVDVVVSEVFETEETELVENNVNAFDTGIFDTTGFDYDGTGMVVAVLDTGTDYYHSAFSMDNFTAEEKNWGLKFNDIQALLAANSFTAEGFTPGLTASDVYISGKLPYGYDYADKDSDVFPINSNHGTHVAGIIAGKDDTITGVAPNAQIVTMKIFSDIQLTARASWIIAALEDCVLLGVDVINMSIGTACGYSRERDKEFLSGVYDKIRERGINMVVAASNSYNSTYSSEKNGNLGLTSNPDSATVGSPSTYEGAMSVASIEGAKTSYILFGKTIIYFEESTNRVAEAKEFVKELLGTDKNELEIEYVVVPGSGIEADYMGIDVKGKIALIRRGTTTFEEKANAAEKMGAAGAIIYNNVSGEIKMNVGDTQIPVCSISQNDGELLAASKTGKIKISYSQAAGPFMSGFSSWGPTPDLGIKPEITAHGGSILSAVPGQDYDRLSGTSMATPNLSGVTALLRQYVIENFPESVASDPVEVAAVINRLLMSTADIIYNKNGNPYSIRKQGAGLANLVSCAEATAYILTYRKDGSVMDKSKIELGDDPAKKGVYDLKFTIDNFGSTSQTYDISALVMTEGVSETKTNQGETTVTETAYMLGSSVAVTAVSGGTQNGNKVTVAGGKKADVTVTITLTDEDKKYLDESFANGMYVEGFVTLDAEGESVDLNAPFLAFYGDWTVAPILDLDYFETNKDELDDSIDLLDKTLPDAFATRPVGGISQDFVSYLGSFYYEQREGSNKIAANRNYISLTNSTEGVNELKYIWAGLLRNADYVEIVITEDSTGEVAFSTIDYDVRKSYGDGGPIRPSNIDVGFSAIDNNLKNNAKYTVTMKAYLDYGEDGGATTNENNTFTFPITIDFQAPTLTGCEFYTEYDKSAKKNRLYAKLAIYDNHYAMAMLPGYVGVDAAGTGFQLENFDRYLTPINSNENSTSYVIYELTDYIDDIKENSYNKNTFAISVYDYALNIATYEIALPDDYVDLYFEEKTITLSPNQTYDLNPIVYPGTEWGELVEYRSSKESVATVVNGKLLATGSGNAVIECKATLKDGTVKKENLTVKVLAKGDEGYKRYDAPVLENFVLYGYMVNKAFYFIDSGDRDIGQTGNAMKFVGENFSLKMFPSESVTIQYDLDAYFPSKTKVVFETSNDTIAKVTADGTITAVKEGYASITAKVLLDGKSTYYSKSISIEVKDPYVISGPSLANYYGNGGLVSIPSSFGITEIGQFAFSNFDYIPKDPSEIDEEDPETTKIWYIGDDSIEEVIIPEGVEKISTFAFANLTKLRKVTLPSTLTTIDYGAFYNCTSLTTIVGIENVKFINRSAFENCAINGSISLNSAIAVAELAFANNPLLTGVTLSENCKSVGAYAFANDSKLSDLTINSDFLKLGQSAFSMCSALKSVSINAAVIPVGAFDGCSSLESITLGKDVAVIGEHAFRKTKIANFTVAEGNTVYKPGTAQYILNAEGTELLIVAPTVKNFELLDANVVTVGYGAFSGNAVLESVNIPSVVRVNDYAFSECESLKLVTLGKLNHIGNYAFTNTAITAIPENETGEIGKYAFASTFITSVNIPDGVIIGEGAFEECNALETVVIGDDVKIGKYAFRYNNGRYDFTTDFRLVNGERVYFYVYRSPLTSLTIGKNADIGEAAFWFAAKLQSVTLGEGAVIGKNAFYTTPELKNIDLSKVKSIGEGAFSGDILYEFDDQDCKVQSIDENNNYRLHYYASAFTTVDLSGATEIGKDSFAYCDKLESVTLGDGITVIPEGAFRLATALESINLDKITSIGDYAFNLSNLTAVNLGSVTEIGKYSFLESESLLSVTLSESIEKIDEGAFAYCGALISVTGLGNAKSVGDYAFAYTDLKSADLTGAEYIGTHAFMKAEDKACDFTLTLGDSLTDIGDNPFVFCKLTPFSKLVNESFNGKDYETTLTTFDISDTVKIIDGSIYRVVPIGLELIYYAGTEPTVNVADRTTRIGAYAFAGSDVVNVILPYTVESIGHKAFFACDNLSIVNFSSYYAPTLEEEYDIYYYYAGTNLPTKPEYDEAVGAAGIGIVDYFMWNVAADPTNTYYGASFKDYVGKVNDKAVMVRPSNGVHYDSFIFGQYFNVILEGASAADDTTLAAIDAINKLPEKVALSDKAQVEAARALYNKIASREQLFLAANAFAKLTAAEKRIADLEYLAENDGNENETPDETPAVELDGMTVLLIVSITIAAGCGIGVAIYFFLKKKNGGNDDGDDDFDGSHEEPVEVAEELTSEDVSAEEPVEVTEELTSEDVSAEEPTEVAEELTSEDVSAEEPAEVAEELTPEDVYAEEPTEVVEEASEETAPEAEDVITVIDEEIVENTNSDENSEDGDR